MGRMSTSAPWGSEDSAKFLSAGRYSAQLSPWPASSPCQHTPCLRESSPRIPIFSLPIRSTSSPCNLPSPDPGLMHCSLSLRTACWLLCPAHSLPSPTHHFQSLRYKLSYQIHLGCWWPCRALERQCLAMSSDLPGQMHVNSKVNAHHPLSLHGLGGFENTKLCIASSPDQQYPPLFLPPIHRERYCRH